MSMHTPLEPLDRAAAAAARGAHAAGGGPGAEHVVAAPDGRRIGVRVLARGGHASRTVVFSAPAPGSAAFDPDPPATLAHGVTLLGVDRPGYGASDPVRGRWADVGMVADDLASVAAAFTDGPVGVAGWSAGGRVALAFAARHPHLVERVVVVATPAPQASVPWMPPEHAAALDALRAMPADEAHAALGAQLADLGEVDPAAASALDLLGIGAADEAVLAAPGVRGRLATMLARALVQGVVGLAQDLAGLSAPWGFVPGEVAAPALLLYGERDPVVPDVHGEWWRAALPASRLEVVADHGHLVVVPAWARALEHLAAAEVG